ncbi:peptide chain release factor N(5)-glutamine methyltransferase [Carnobacterium mobile]|uniref:peptide chain release factor N(5)-glutamine methyltransferase n=1 Tax=Carnobacterium mobile TaxID=2750 RepID=UPI001866EA56|nr:peptide chain release factor N(5)-glutamine methyltransferase [Carnobacterium mobile]
MKIDETYREVLKWASSFLEDAGQEATAAEFLLRGRLNWSKTDFILHLENLIPVEIKRQLIEDVKQHSKGIPIQHILGYEWFYDYCFKVTKDTLIPRPETEEIVDKFLKYAPSRSLTVLDIGTGTGAIAITIKKERPQDEVTGIDLSNAALTVSKENAAHLQADVRFLAGDLTAPVKAEQFDVVISNPPYIGENEKIDMDESVLKYEPQMALFAENNGLAIYQRLAEEIPAILKPDGQIFLEIGFRQGEAVKGIFQAAFPNAKVEVEKDMSGHDRLITVKQI